MLDFAINYLHILKTKLAGLNLTKILDHDEFYNKQILDSINPYLDSKLFQAEVEDKRVVVDVGFGGGFPLLPLAKLLPDKKFIGIESRRKKVEAVDLIAQELKIANAKVLHCRLEDFLFDVPAVITFKAVGTVKDYLSIINATTKDLTVFFYKGPGFLEQEQESIKILEKNWKLIDNQKIKVPGTNERYLVCFKAENVPRGTSKNLVKLSEII